MRFQHSLDMPFSAPILLESEHLRLHHVCDRIEWSGHWTALEKWAQIKLNKQATRWRTCLSWMYFKASKACQWYHIAQWQESAGSANDFLCHATSDSWPASSISRSAAPRFAAEHLVPSWSRRRYERRPWSVFQYVCSFHFVSYGNIRCNMSCFGQRPMLFSALRSQYKVHNSYEESASFAKMC